MSFDSWAPRVNRLVSKLANGGHFSNICGYQQNKRTNQGKTLCKECGRDAHKG